MPSYTSISSNVGLMTDLQFTGFEWFVNLVECVVLKALISRSFHYIWVARFLFFYCSWNSGICISAIWICLLLFLRIFKSVWIWNHWFNELPASAICAEMKFFSLIISFSEAITMFFVWKPCLLSIMPYPFWETNCLTIYLLESLYFYRLCISRLENKPSYGFFAPVKSANFCVLFQSRPHVLVE